MPQPSLFEGPSTDLATPETPVTQEHPAHREYPEHRAEARLQMGDATDPKTLPRESIDLVVTSPPYNLEKPYSQEASSDSLSYESYEAFSKRWLRNCYDWARSTGRLCVNVPMDTNKNGKRPLAADVTAWAMAVGWQYHATILWNEGNISRRTAWGSWKSASAPHVIAPVEVIIVLYKDAWKRLRPGHSDITAEDFKKWVLGLWSFPGESARRIGHPAPFPPELAKRCLQLFSFVGDTVLDPFVGSGTTLIEAVKHKRRAVGIELEEPYCDLTRKRLKKECELSLKLSQQEKAEKSTGKCWTL